MATYHHNINITASEMIAFLGVREFHPIYPDGTAELVFAKPIHPGLTLRIYTGINSNGQSRAVGKDAIRVCIFQGERIVGASKRVHRVKGWRKNLDDRISGWKELLGPTCPNCGGRMIERHSRKNKKYVFWGCANYPRCNGFQPKN